MKEIHIFTVFLTPKTFFDGQFKYLTEHGHEIILISSADDEANEFADKNNIRYIPVEMPRSLSVRNILKAIKAIVAIIKSENPDSVFGHTPVGAFCAMISARLCGIKNRIYYRHGLIYTTMKGEKRVVFKMEEKFVSSLATAVINVSPSLSALAVRDGLNSSKKNNVIGYGTCGGIDSVNVFNPAHIDCHLLISLKNDLEICDSTIVFGFCGRICKDKGIPELVDGFKLFKNKHSDLAVKLLLIGDYDIRDCLPIECKKQIETDGDIVKTGFIHRDKLPYYYSMLDAFVFPSHREGFGMCVLEASAMEKPILVSRSHGCVDSIVEHITGEYIDLTANDICDGMELMLDAKRRECYGGNGRKVVLERYDHQVMWPQIESLYSRLLE